MWYNSIWNSIYNIVNWLVAWTKLQAVYNYDAKSSEVFPYAIITTKDGAEDMLDTASNLMTYNFLVRVVNINKDVSALEWVMRQLCDDILAELRKEANETLSWTVDLFLPSQVTWGWADWSEPTRIFEINIEVQKIFAI
jgi:hypothetical protein